MTLSSQPLSPLDGRYLPQVRELGEHLSEAGLNRARVQVEVEWLIWLVEKDLLQVNKTLTEKEAAKLRELVSEFSDESVEKLGKIEATTRHDVKAVEYFVRDALTAMKREDLHELVHFACTSEDINNLSYAITVHDALERAWLPKAKDALVKITRMAGEMKNVPMLSRTHGQPATPTTMGKEFAVFAHRLSRQLHRIENQEILGKFSGATGTFAAHLAAAPEVDWPAQSKAFVEHLGFQWNPLTTQIESHDWQAELYSSISHFNRILHNLATDVWTYISLGFFKQIPVAGATGSSTMPHKINPIRFENAEANLELSCAILDSLSQTLVTSRMQRDLTDSSAQRNIGVGFGHSLLALDNINCGLDEIAISEGVLMADLLENWEVLGEAIQTAIRADVARGESKISDPYAMLKELTRGKRVGEEELLAFVNELDVSDATKARLLVLKPSTYLGLSAELVEYLAD
ncbi:MAG: adenylosuccinate lyase [Micrococcales bacterium]|nr:adenylosuccinate lyase [Micrococcales bacterium]